MELIDKAAVVKEIERRITNHNKELEGASDEDFVSSWASDEENQKLALTALIPFLNTLEVKEVNLNDAIEHYVEQHKSELNGYFDIRRIAKYFFVLGLNAKKGE